MIKPNKVEFPMKYLNIIVFTYYINIIVISDIVKSKTTRFFTFHYLFKCSFRNKIHLCEKNKYKKVRNGMEFAP